MIPAVNDLWLSVALSAAGAGYFWRRAAPIANSFAESRVLRYRASVVFWRGLAIFMAASALVFVALAVTR